MAGTLQFLFRENPRRSVIATVSFVIASLLDALALISIVPVVMIFSEGLNAEDPLGRVVIEFYRFFNVEPTVPAILMTVGLLVLLRSALQMATLLRVSLEEAELATEYRQRFVHALLGARWEYLVTLSAGRLQAIMLNEARIASEAATAAYRVLANGLMLCVYIPLALIVSWQMTLLAVLLGGGTILLLQRFVTMVQHAAEENNVAIRSLSKTFQETITGAKSLKAMALEGPAILMIETATHDIRSAMRKRALGHEFRQNIQEPVLLLGLFVGGYVLLVNLQSLGTVVFLIILLERTVRRIMALQVNYQHFVEATHAFDTLHKAHQDALAHPDPTSGNVMPCLNRDIVFHNVTVERSGKALLSDVSLTLPYPGLTVVVGASGAGKTTLTDLILRLATPTSGEILVDGQPLETLEHAAWHRMIGYVPQDGLLLHDSIATNVSLGDPDVTEDMILSALKAAEAISFVKALDEGIEANIGERGARLSGGERQRLLLARALVRKPRLLVLDEATSALDPQTDRAISETLLRLSRSMTIVGVAHKSALIEIANSRVILEGGRVVGDVPAEDA